MHNHVDIIQHCSKTTVKEISINLEELVPGDIVIINKGQYIPADVRLTENSSDFAVDQLSLTGETEPVPKNADIQKDADSMPHEAANMVWFGTYCVQGTGKGIVTSIGDDTFIGRIGDRAIYDLSDDDIWKTRIYRYRRWMSLGMSVVNIYVYAIRE